MQLVAIGQQDAYLTENPTITFWKRAYQRHTNFAVESIEQTFVGQVQFGGTASVNISRNGDLLNKAYIHVQLPALSTGKYVENVGHALIRSVTMSIGGQKIDRHTGEWMHLWNRMAGKNLDGLSSMIGSHRTKDAQTLYIPLHFWWNRTPGMALPLIALQYHEVKIEVNFAPLSELTVTGDSPVTPVVETGGALAAKLYVDYVYIDNEERKRFAQANHEYLIDQVQETSESFTGNHQKKIGLNFNHPVKELVWVIKKSALRNEDRFHFGQERDGCGWWCVEDRADSLDAANAALKVQDPTSEEIMVFSTENKNTCANNNTISKAKISLNGHDRFSERDAKYFNLVQPYQHHSNMPGDGVYSYSFALDPESEQPSGSCNFSRIDRAELVITPDDTTGVSETKEVTVFAVNFNVLRLMGGMGGVAYAN